MKYIERKHKNLRRKSDSERKRLLASLEWKMCTQFVSLQQSKCGKKKSHGVPAAQVCFPILS